MPTGTAQFRAADTDVDGDLAGLRLAWGASALASEADRRAARRRGREGAGAFRTPPPRGRQPAKAPIWEEAAFFSTWASAGAS